MVVVRRGSHVHHTPHEWRAQMDPETSASPLRTKPTSAAAPATASQWRLRVFR